MSRLGMMERAKAFAKKRLPPRARRLLRGVYRRVRTESFFPYESWSQMGEDLILRNVFHGVQAGFFVDIGAAHPKYASNTYLLYKQGWRGINVDAAPGSMKSFRRVRTRDINIESGVGDVPGELPFYVFADEVLNTFDAELAKQRSRQHHLDRVVNVHIRTLASLLDEHASGRMIDLLSVDCEGYDERVLRSNDWSRFRPHVVVVESLEGPKTAAELPVRSFLEENGYVLFSNTPFNLFFRDEKWVGDE
jgi:FkbM family methyltransferase